MKMEFTSSPLYQTIFGCGSPLIKQESSTRIPLPLLINDFPMETTFGANWTRTSISADLVSPEIIPEHFD